MIKIERDCEFTLKCDDEDLHLIYQALKIARCGPDYEELSEEEMSDLEVLIDRLQLLFEAV